MVYGVGGVLELVGRTPIVKVMGIYAKLETTNPSGSIKDRIAKEMVEAAERDGQLREGQTIVEPTSGNTGIALSMVAAIKGYKMIVVMPDNMSVERRQMIAAYGAEIVLTQADEGVAGAVRKAREIAKEKGAFMPDQFSNPNNLIAHERGGREILEQIGAVDAIVAGTGTGGTLMGTAKALRLANPELKVIAVEPVESAVMSGGPVGEHDIQGIGDGFVPALVKMDYIDEVIQVSTAEAEEMSKRLAKEFGLLVGTSSGANMVAALRVKERYKKVVTFLPDRGERYLSKGRKGGKAWQ